jgi:hypothetical protein
LFAIAGAKGFVRLGLGFRQRGQEHSREDGDDRDDDEEFDEGEGGNFHFTTKDPAKSVLSFYEDSLKRAGFTISGNIKGDLGAASGGMLAAEDPDKRSVMVTVGSENGATNVNVVFGTKKK